jgi:hypothetical protein
MADSPFLPLPAEDQGAKIAALRVQLDSLASRVGAAEGRLFSYPPRRVAAFDQNGQPYQYEVLAQQSGSWPGFDNTSFPFQVTVTGSASTGYTATVNPESDLLLSLNPSNSQTITGLGVPLTIDPTNFLIWLYITISYGTVTAATIQHGAYSGGSFDPSKPTYDPSYESWISNDDATPPTPKTQISTNVMIAYSGTTSTADKPVIVQACSTHLYMDERCISGIASLVALPSPYRRYGV